MGKLYRQVLIIKHVSRLAPNMLKNLPIIPSRTSQNFYLLFLFSSQVPPINSIMSVIIITMYVGLDIYIYIYIYILAIYNLHSY